MAVAPGSADCVITTFTAFVEQRSVAVTRGGGGRLSQSTVVSAGTSNRSGAVVSATTLDIVNNNHPITRGLPIGPLQVYSAAANTSVAQGAFGAGVQTLAEHLVLKHHTVVELLDRLETAGYVRRERAADDRRRAEIVLTPRGADVLRKLSNTHLDELRLLAPELVGALHGVLRASKRSAS